MLYYINRHLSLLTAAILISGCGNAPKSSTTPVPIVEEFLSALAAEDAERALALLTEDTMLHAPYNQNGDASDAAIRSFPASFYVKGAIGTYDNLVFTDRAFSIADNGHTVWLEAEGRLRVAATGTPYENRDVFKIKVDGDKIASITEYTNVATLAKHGVTAQVE